MLDSTTQIPNAMVAWHIADLPSLIPSEVASMKYNDNGKDEVRSVHRGCNKSYTH